jgi:hypothetical protein
MWHIAALTRSETHSRRFPGQFRRNSRNGVDFVLNNDEVILNTLQSAAAFLRVRR